MEIPRHWRLKRQRYLLEGEICNHCEAKLFPPRAVCPECGGETETNYRFSGEGKTYSYQTLGNSEQPEIIEADMVQTRIGVEN